jgi:hypothetical protein
LRRLTLIYAYYDNPGMLARQYTTWANYPKWYRDRVKVVIVDDASPRWPALEVPRPVDLPALEVYRVAVDIPWHQDGARNLGAHVADGWLFLSDMDHVLPAESLPRVWRCTNQACFYTFDRWDAGPNAPMVDGQGKPKPHPNTYLLHRDLYWDAGGYDESFCGVYGTDGEFRRQLARAGYHRHLDGVNIVRYSREVVPDASTTTLDRKKYGGTPAKIAAHERKAAAGLTGRIVTLDFEWERVL